MEVTMKKDRICPYCKTEFQQIDGKIFANHVRWCTKNTSNGDKGKAAHLEAMKKFAEVHFKKLEIECLCCRKKIFVSSKRSNQRFCSRSCSNKMRKISLSARDKISKSLLSSAQRKIKICSHCGNSFTGRLKYCSDDCRIAEKRKHLSDYQLYRLKCQFHFSLKDYPSKFDFALIEKYGWYRAKNRGNNLNGISRDHAVSIKFGWLNKISPDIISHPANCVLMRHTENKHKNTNCSLTLEELLEKIKQW